MYMASSDKFQFLQQVKHYNALIKSLESSLRNSTVSFGPDSEQARFCKDMLSETLREAANVGVICSEEQQDSMDVDPDPQVAGANEDVPKALQELREKLSSVKIS